MRLLRRRPVLLPLLLPPLLLVHSAVYQLQHVIPRRHTQCIYSDFQSGQTATFEVFILASASNNNNNNNNGRLAAGVQIEGPIASDKIGEVVTTGNDEETSSSSQQRTSHRIQPEDTWDPHRFANNPHEMTQMGSLLQDAINNWPQFLQRHTNNFQERGIIHHFFHLDYTHSGENEDAIRARAEITRQIQRREEEERWKNKRRMEEQQQRREVEEVYEKENTAAGRVQHILPDRIAPYEWTKRIKNPGWYRICVQADDDILVEMDIRNSAIFGGVNEETGHVYTFADWEEWEEEQRINKLNELKEKAKADREAQLLMEQLNAALKDQIKDYDLEATQRLMTQVNSLVSEMQQKQGAVHQRIKSHEGIAKRNYQRIKKSGIVETVLYLLITGYQVYTVHNWLLSTNSLGR
ncbi:hypothetical protein ACHAXM_004103 [Skeletonema potamos]